MSVLKLKQNGEWVPISVGAQGKKGDPGNTGPANTLTIGSVTSGNVASATITGEAPNQTLNLVLKQGDKGNPGDDAPTITNIVIRQSDYHMIVTLSDGTSYDAGYCRGASGEGTGDMLASTYDPQGKAQDIFAYADAKYSKPSGGIPKTDLASDVQTSLIKADSALQSVTKSDVGLGNVDNVKQYSTSNPPPYPVTSVNGQTGDVTVQSGSEAASYTATLTTSGWAQSGSRYAQTVNVAGVTASTPVVLVDVALSGADIDADAAALEAWGIVSANNVAQGAGTLTFYALSVPSVNVPVNVGVC